MEQAKSLRIFGLSHGTYEGEEIQLQVAFILKGDLKLVYAHYGKNIADVPTVEEVVGFLSVIK